MRSTAVGSTGATTCSRGQLATGVVPAGTALSGRPSWIDEWASLSPDAQRMLARQQEVFAGFLSHTDAQIGRVVAQLDGLGELDNTLIMLISDNGASGEGGALGTFNEHRFTEHVPDTVEGNLAWSDELGGLRSYPHYSWGWAWAGNTPLRLWKRYTWLGGTRTPLVVHWPRGIEDGGAVRDQFVHAVDLMPTVLDAAGIDPPDAVDGVEQQPVDGASIRVHVLRRDRAVTAHDAVLRDARVAFDRRRRLEGDHRPRVEGRGRRGASASRAAASSPTTSGRCSV